MLTIANVSFQDAVQYLLHHGIQRHFGKKYQQDFDYNFLTATKQLTPIGWCAQQSRYSNDWDKLNGGDDDWYEGCQACFFKSEWTSWNNFGWVYFLFCSVTRMLEMQWQECDQGGLKEDKNYDLVIVFFFLGQSQNVLLFLIHQIQKSCSPGIPKGSRSLCRLEFVQMHHNLYGTDTMAYIYCSALKFRKNMQFSWPKVFFEASWPVGQKPLLHREVSPLAPPSHPKHPSAPWSSRSQTSLRSSSILSLNSCPSSWRTCCRQWSRKLDGGAPHAKVAEYNTHLPKTLLSSRPSPAFHRCSMLVAESGDRSSFSMRSGFFVCSLKTFIRAFKGNTFPTILSP